MDKKEMAWKLLLAMTPTSEWMNDSKMVTAVQQLNRIACGETKKIIVDRKVGARRIVINDRKTK